MVKASATVLLILCFFLLTAALTHKFHVSRCEIHFRPDRQSLEIAQQIFVDDFEEALKALYSEKPLHLGTGKEHADADKYILQYIREKFVLIADGKLLEYQFIGRELSEDLSAIWIYLEVQGISDPKVLSVEFSVLLELFDDQKNILSFQKNGGKESIFLLSNATTHAEIAVQ